MLNYKVKTGGPGGFSYENRLAEALQQESGLRVPLEIKIINQAPVSFSFQVIRGKLRCCRDE